MSAGITFKGPPLVTRREEAPEEPTCKSCGGVGKERLDEWTYRLCSCVMRRVIRQRLGDLAAARHVETSPLYDERCGADMTQTNLLLSGEWTDVAGQDRTGHKSSIMINTYRRKARSHAETRLGDLAPMHLAIPELAEIEPDSGDAAEIESTVESTVGVTRIHFG